jgi:hypothetical protein
MVIFPNSLELSLTADASCGAEPCIWRFDRGKVGSQGGPCDPSTKLTLDEIARRNYTEGTTRAYLRIIEDLARYFHRSPDQLDLDPGPERRTAGP